MIPSENDEIKLINFKLIDNIKQKAYKSSRKRMNFNFHPTLEDNPHRFLNILLSGTYIQPHRHLEPPKAESFIILEGKVIFFLFDERGIVTQCFLLEPFSIKKNIPRAGNIKNINAGIDIAPGIWHTLIPASSEAVCYEVKPGPYKPITDKEFAPWAPKEGDKKVAQYLTHLKLEAMKKLNKNLQF